jgi:glutathione peroxidase
MKIMFKIGIFIGTFALIGLFFPIHQKDKPMSQSIYDFSINSLEGERIDFTQYKGKVLLLVNTASECGFTPQYEGLQELYMKYKDQGLVIIGFPCNQFGHQEPGDKAEIGRTCFERYNVTFPITEKIEVNGPGAHPIFQYLVSEKSGFLSKKIKWNFTKFLVDREGKVVDRFAPWTKPDKIDRYLQKKFF